MRCSDNWMEAPPYRGCGFIKSTPGDMCKYYGMLANGGQYQGRQVMPACCVEWMVGKPFAETEKMEYCFALEKQVYGGQTLCFHGGAIKGVSAQQTQQLAPKMIEVVSRLVECPEDWVTVELCESKFFDKNGPTEQYPIIQIWWYQRPLPVQNQVARELSELFLKEGFPLVQVSFHLFAESDYYEFE